MNILDTNAKLGRESFFDTSTSMVKQEYTDAKIASVPDFIARLAKSPYDKVIGDLALPSLLDLDQPTKSFSLDIDNEAIVLADREDLQTQMLLADKYVRSYTRCVQQLGDYYSSSIAPPNLRSTESDLIKKIIDALWQGHRVANQKELLKRQVLVGSPTWHHGCSDGDHFNIKSNLDEDKHDTLVSIGASLGDFVRNNFGGIERSSTYTLPLTSSQGVILKSRRDSPQFRAVSKALQGRYAQLCDNESELLECIERLNDLAESKGYDRFFDCFFLGKRKQHAAKDEPIDNGDSFMEVTKGIQGRVRGIFPPPEMFKVYYKPFSDGLKKFLFKDTAICSVDVNDIHSKHLHAIANYIVNLANNSGSADGLSHGFYDLSAYDRNTSASLGLAYQTFCSIVFDSWDSKEKQNFTNFKLLFPKHCAPHSEIMIQEIKYRSTLSGQPDVTVKNNICHLILLCESIDRIIMSHFDKDGSWSSCDKHQRRDSIWEFLLLGKKINALPGLVAKIHGDDAFLSWVGQRSEHMEVLHSTFAEFGIPCADEESLIYLKRTFDLQRLSSMFSKMKDFFVKDAFSSTDSANIVKRLKSDPFIINNVTGSIVRNRFGEYPILEPIVGLLSLIDTLSKLPDDGTSHCIDYWLDCVDYYDDVNNAFKIKQEATVATLKFKNISDEKMSNNQSVKQVAIREKVSNVIRTFREKTFGERQRSAGERHELKLTCTDTRNELSTMLNELLIDKSDVANELRGFLSRLYYSNFEQFDDDELANLYGDLFYNENDISSDAALSGKNRTELMDMILALQQQIFEKDGEVVLPKEFSSIGKNLLEKM